MRSLLRVGPVRRTASHFQQCRRLSVTVQRQTDGVFRELTNKRIQTPWVEALRKKQKEGHDPTQASGKPETPAERDLSPKKMSDSYHSVV